jgi:hypothetical protein
METKVKRVGADFRTGTIAYYGPNDKNVTKVIVGITVGAGENFIDTKKWSSESRDIKNDNQVLEEISAYLTLSQVDSVARMERVIGCPHEAGVDYPEGMTCPACPFWANEN